MRNGSVEPFPYNRAAEVQLSEDRRSLTVRDPWPIKRPEGGGVVTFRILAAESIVWYPADELTLLISGREVPVQSISAAFVKYINPADIAKWRDYSIPLTEDTERLMDGDHLIVTLKDARHYKGKDIAKP